MLVSILAAVASIIAVSIAFGRPTFSFRSVFANAGEGFVFSLSGSTTYIYNDLDKVMLGHYGMNAANGIYTTAYRILNICTTPIASIHYAAYPRFFQLGVRGARVTEPFARKVLRKLLCSESPARWACFLPLRSFLISWVRASPTLCPPCAGFASSLCFAVFISARETP